MGSVVDLLLGGGRCYFKPQSDATSCRSDDVDLFGYARDKGYRVLQDRAAFDALEKGKTKAGDLPYIGLFNDGTYEFFLLSENRGKRGSSAKNKKEAIH